MSIVLDFTSASYNGGTTINKTYTSNQFNSDFTSDGLGYRRTPKDYSLIRKTGVGKTGRGQAQISSNQNLLPRYQFEFELILMSTEMTDIFEIFDAQYKSTSLGFDWTLTLSDNLIPEPLTLITIDGSDFIRQNATGANTFSPPEATPAGTDTQINPKFSIIIVDLLWDWAFQSDKIDYHIVQVRAEELDPLLFTTPP